MMLEEVAKGLAPFACTILVTLTNGVQHTCSFSRRLAGSLPSSVQCTLKSCLPCSK